MYFMREGGRKPTTNPRPCSQPTRSEPARFSAFKFQYPQPVNDSLHGRAEPSLAGGEEQGLSLRYLVIYDCVKVEIINLELHLLRESGDGELIAHGKLSLLHCVICVGLSRPTVWAVPQVYKTRGDTHPPPVSTAQLFFWYHLQPFHPATIQITLFSTPERPSPPQQPQKWSVSSLASMSHHSPNHKTFICPGCFNISFLRALERKRQIIHGVIPSAFAAGKGFFSLLLTLIKSPLVMAFSSF